MPRSKPQDTRRKLYSALKHIYRAVDRIYEVLPWDLNTKDWDESYLELVAYANQMMTIYYRIYSVLNPDEE